MAPWTTMSTPFDEEPETARLLLLAERGDSSAAGKLLDRHRDRLARMVRVRLDPRLRGRMGVSDVLQESYMEAFQRMGEYLHSPDVPFYIWLRFIALQRILTAHRRHIAAKGRAVARELPLDSDGPTASSVSIAAEFIGRETSPTGAAARAELSQLLSEALEALEPIDREILALRHLEQLSNLDVARVLQLDPAAASKRYVRALRRVRTVLGEIDLGQDPGAGHGKL